jgi:hypothetical protein
MSTIKLLSFSDGTDLFDLDQTIFLELKEQQKMMIFRRVNLIFLFLLE